MSQFLQPDDISPLPPPTRRLDEVRDRFVDAWSEGRRPRIEDYLTDSQEPLRSAMLRLLLRLELAHLRQHQVIPDVGEYEERFPGHLELVHAIFDDVVTHARPPSTPEGARLLQHEMSPVRSEEGDAVLPPRLGRYRVTARLGAGTFGVVYQARDEELGRDVAIKVPHRHRIRTPQDIDAYLAEARALAGLTHPGIVPVYDVGRTEDGRCYLVSRLVSGSDLQRRARNGRLAHPEAAAVVARSAEALHHAHQHGLVHRDVKPANILLDESGRPLITDFGLALREEDFGTGPTFTGTPAYMSPEQARGEGHRVDARTDVFSLGVVFYELLTGSRPFRGPSTGKMLAQIKELEPRPPRQLDDTIPKELDRICLKSLSKRASDRYSTALDLAEDLWHWLAQDAGPRPPPAGVIRPPEVNVRLQPVPAGFGTALSGPPPAGSDSDAGPPRVVPKGLRSFDAEDADFFLELLPGPRHRDGLPEGLRFWKARVEATDPEKAFRVGLLYGPSGCGKSSLVKAGLLPRLAESVLSLYVEATPDDTETRLLKGLRKCCPDLGGDRGLVETLAGLRRTRVSGRDRKVLIVLDQFEQWLHAQKGEPTTELVQALRQCDGEHVQCLVLVRDDFGMAAARFMSELEIPILEGRNFATADLFDLRHARRVLRDFGRAFGCLPGHREELSHSQEQFLDQAVAGLAQEGRVISVRLAVFAEMVKGKSWTPASLKEVGGVEGLGAAFLDETLGARAANPERRLHLGAARAVLKALLPERGAEITGSMRSHRTLIEASGYVRRPQAFDQLLRVLDTELRLITPTDPDETTVADGRSEAAAGSAPSTVRYYRLTHDYLVPALRQWLTRQQRETRRGRTELLLAERTTLWTAMREGRQLPGWWEWANILLLTRKGGWTVPQRQMLRAATRKHLRQAGVLTLALALTGWVGVEVMRGPLEASALVRELASAETDKVPDIIKELSSRQGWVVPRLRAMAEDAHDDKRRLHASLALLSADPERGDELKNYLYNRLLEAEDPKVFRVICESLGDPSAKHYVAFVPRLWALLETTTDPDLRFRAACALGYYDPRDPRWQELIHEVAGWLVRQHPDHSLRWARSNLIVLAYRLVPALEKILDEPGRPESEQAMASELIVTSVSLQISWGHLGERVLKSEGRPYEVLLSWFLANREEAMELMKGVLDREPLPPDAPENNRDELAKRRAHAAVVLLRLDQPEGHARPLRHADRLWPMLGRGSDPRARAYLIHRLGRVAVDPEPFLQRYADETDESLARALLLSLGEIDRRLPPAKRQALHHKILHDYRTHPDVGVHSAADWLLRRWGLDEARRRIEQELAGRPPVGRNWYVTQQQGHTMAVLPSPVTYRMGSPEGERNRGELETPHRRRIPRSFALATKEVTVEQFREFLQGHPDVAAQWQPRLERHNPDEPILGVTWLEAVQYCRWLSEREHVPENQSCYPPHAVVEKSKDGVTPLPLPPDYLRRTGYRLPTEAEWEYACRAGAVASRHFGGDDALLDPYAWFVRNSHGRAHAVGSKMPNDFGLFDMYGSASEWCQDALAPYPRAAGESPVEDAGDQNPVDPSASRVLRGGFFGSTESELRSAYRSGFQPHVGLGSAGLRVARTEPPPTPFKE